jgi:hypothetical protein
MRRRGNPGGVKSWAWPWVFDLRARRRFVALGPAPTRTHEPICFKTSRSPCPSLLAAMTVGLLRKRRPRGDGRVPKCVIADGSAGSPLPAAPGRGARRIRAGLLYGLKGTKHKRPRTAAGTVPNLLASRPNPPTHTLEIGFVLSFSGIQSTSHPAPNRRRPAPGANLHPPVHLRLGSFSQFC